MAALATVQDYITDARTLLQDTVVTYRYDDPSLLVALNVTLLDARRLRPDLFLGDGTSTLLPAIPSFDTVDTTVVPVEQGFRLAVLYGMCAHALARDQEDIQDSRSTAFMTLFNKKLLTLDI